MAINISSFLETPANAWRSTNPVASIIKSGLKLFLDKEHGLSSEEMKEKISSVVTQIDLVSIVNLPFKFANVQKIANKLFTTSHEIWSGKDISWANYNVALQHAISLISNAVSSIFTFNSFDKARKQFGILENYDTIPLNTALAGSVLFSMAVLTKVQAVAQLAMFYYSDEYMNMGNTELETKHKKEFRTEEHQLSDERKKYLKSIFDSEFVEGLSKKTVVGQIDAINERVIRCIAIDTIKALSIILASAQYFYFNVAVFAINTAFYIKGY